MALSTISQAGLAAPLTLTLPVVATTMGVGGATPSGSGSGITFPATQSASSDANTLDDYEEGTWTPAFANQGTLVFDIRNGRYTKIGNMVFAQFHIDISSTGTASGGLTFTNLPFAAKNASAEYGTSTALHAYSWTTARAGLNSLVSPSSTHVDFYYGAANTGGGTTPTFADIGVGNMLGTAIYITD